MQSDPSHMTDVQHLVNALCNMTGPLNKCCLLPGDLICFSITAHMNNNQASVTDYIGGQ